MKKTTKYSTKENIKDFFVQNLNEIKRVSQIEKYVREDDTHERRNKKIIYSFAAAMAFLITTLNVAKGIVDMAISTALLGTGLMLATIINEYAAKSEKIKIKSPGDIVITFVAACILCYWMISGSNDGFAVWWMLVATPIIGIINRPVGMSLAVFLLIFNMCCCWIPGIRENIAPFYTTFFLDRFPLIYFSNFLIVFYIIVERDKNQRTLITKTYFDDLTKMNNRRFFLKLIEYIEGHDKKEESKILVADLNGLKYVNDTFGHEKGDLLIKGGGECLKKIFSNALSICRVGGDEYAGILMNDDTELEKYKEALEEVTNEWSKDNGVNLSISIGIVSWKENKKYSFEELYALADRKMYENKSKFYVENHIERRKNIADRRRKDV